MGKVLVGVVDALCLGGTKIPREEVAFLSGDLERANAGGVQALGEEENNNGFFKK
jgi:hypothetical protein